MRILRSLTLSAALLTGLYADELIQYGGFESNAGTGTSLFGAWNVYTQPGGAGDWYVQTGTTPPYSTSITVPAPPEGTYAAMTDSSGPGSQVLLQRFTVPVGATSVVLSFDYFVLIPNTQDFVVPSPQSLDYTVNGNEQSRVDILSNVAEAFDVGADDLFTAFQTNPGDPNQYVAYATTSIDITAAVTPGQNYQLRFAEVDNLGQLFFGVDDVSIQAIVVTTPEPGAGLMLALFGIGCLLHRRGRLSRPPNPTPSAKSHPVRQIPSHPRHREP